jgi:AGZA family xanthine/uracil permease-like MFS transporter
MSTARVRHPLWVRGDLDGFFGLMVDNLVQVLLIVDLCKFLCGLPDLLIYERILPGVAISLLIGNIFYGLQARWVARRHNNPACTALPYGINTPSVIAYAYFIMAPVYRANVDALGAADAGHLAWQAGLLACLVSGIIEFCGAFFAERLRKATPRAALLGVLAGVGITFIAADFAFRIYTRPLVGLLPLAILLLAYFARFQFPWRLPGGFLAILVGSLIAWGTTLTGTESFGGVAMDAGALQAAISPDTVGWITPTFVGPQIWDLLISKPDLVLLFLTVSVPMGVINVLGALQNIESAEAGGDRFATGPSLAVNGVGTIAAGLFGSCFPTTIYIGHPGWKALGARASYSIVNGVFFTLIFLLGLGPCLRALIPIEAGAAIVVYIGIIITAQAFQATPKSHAPAVAIALFPALAAIIVVTLGLYFGYPGIDITLADVLAHPTPTTEYLPGLIALTGANSGWIVVTLILAAIGAALTDHRYRAAAVWAGAATVLTLLGAIHAYRLEGNVIREFFIWQGWDGVARASTQAAATTARITYRAFPIAVGYALATVLFALAAWRCGPHAAESERSASDAEA